MADDGARALLNGQLQLVKCLRESVPGMNADASSLKKIARFVPQRQTQYPVQQLHWCL